MVRCRRRDTGTGEIRQPRASRFPAADEGKSMTFEQMKIFLEATHFGSFTHAPSGTVCSHCVNATSIYPLPKRRGPQGIAADRDARSMPAALV